jgi:large repetitive protein
VNQKFLYNRFLGLLFFWLIGGLFSSLSAQMTGNTISSTQTIVCPGVPFALTGPIPTGCTAPYTYLWESSSDNSSWTSTGVTTQSYSPSISANTYFRRLSSATGAGCTNVPSNSIGMAVHLQPSAPTNLIEATICAGQIAILQANVGINGDDIRWWDQITNGVIIATGSNYTPAPSSTTTYYITTYNTITGCESSPRIPITVTVTVLGNPTNISAVQRCGPGNVTLTATPGAGGNDIRWFYPTTVLVGQGSPFTYAVSGSITIFATTYNTSTGCSSGEVGTAITVFPLTGTNTILTDQVICTGGTPLALTGSTPTGGNGSYTYTWESSPDMFTWGPVTGATGINFAPGTLTSNIYYRRLVTSAVCNPISSNMIVIQVDSPLGNNTVSAAQTICTGFSPAQFIGSAPTGGSSGYTYQWQSSSDNISFSNVGGGNSQNLVSNALTASTYFRRVATAGPCTPSTSNSVLVTVIPIVTNNSVSAAQTICAGTAPNQLTATNPAGGTGAYSFQWESSTNNTTFLPVGGATASTYTPPNLNNTTYYRMVVSSVCTNTSSSLQVTVHQIISANTLASNQTICLGSASPQIVGSSPAGGAGSYTYNWQSSPDNVNWTNTGITTISLTPPALSANAYFRRVVSSPPCAANTSTVVSYAIQSPIVQNTIGNAQTVCANVATQQFTGSLPSGGNGAYTYSWESSTDNLNWINIGQNTITYNPGLLAASRYWRRIVTSAPCAPSTSASVFILVFPVIANTTISANQTICTGLAPAAFSGLTVTGGTGSYTYQWQSSSDNVNWTNMVGETNTGYTSPTLTANTYFRRLIDSQPCSNISNAITVTINQTLGNNSVGNDQTLCSGQAAAILTGQLPIGGTGVFTYQWQSSLNNSTWTNQTGGNAQNFSPGVMTQNIYYRRIVTSGVCASATSAVVTITVNTLITGNTLTGNQTICSGAQPSEITGTTPSGGTGSYSYTWQSSPDNVNWTTVPQETDQNLTAPVPTASIYYRRIVPAGVCVTSTSASVLIVLQNALGNNSIVANQTICTGTSPSQFVGSIPSGGSGAYTYQWMSSTDDFTFNNIPGATLPNYNGPVLTQYTYFRRVAISGVCNPLTSSSLTVLVNSAIGQNTIGSVQSICANTAFSLITGTSPSGGNGLYTYTWQTSSNNVNWFNVGGSTSIDQNPFTITGSTYFRRVVNSAPCPSNTSAAVLVFTEPAITNNTVGSNQTICTGSTPAALTGSVPLGGNGIFSYQWESSLTTATWTTIPGETNTGFSPPALTVTSYYRRLAGAGLCVPASASLVTIQVDNFIGTNLIGNAQTICNGSVPTSLTGTVPTGGSGAYVYLWQTSTDSTNWGNASGLNTLQGYASGPLLVTTYYRRIVNSGICNQDTSGVMRVTVQNFLSGNSLGNAQTVCAGTAPAMFTGTDPSGGAGNYTYTWESSNDNVTWFNIPGETGLTFTNGPIVAATYFRRVVVSGTCPILPSNAVLVLVQLGISNNIIGNNQAICESIVPALLTGAIPAGGNGIYTYQWETSSDNITWSSAAGVSNNIDYLPTVALTTNSYFRRSVSSGVCANSISGVIAVTVYPIPTVTVANIAVCLGQSGTIIAVPSLPGGTFLWNTGSGTPSITISPFTTTTYTVQYTLNGCISPIAQGVVTVNPLPVPVITATGPLILCPSGSVSLIASGGLNYAWSTGATTNSINVSSPGTFKVVVTDLNGCIDSTFTSVTQPAPINIVPTVVNPSCFGFQDGSVSLTVTGGTLPYGFTWNTNPIQNIRNIFNLGIGTYSVSVSDLIGCSATSTVVLTEPRPLSIYSTHNTIACTPLLNTGVATTFVSGGTPTYSYLWNSVPPQATSGAFNLTPGSYSVTVTDGNGCVIADTVTLITDIAPSVTAIQDTYVCANSGGVQLNASGSGGIGPYTYVWTQSNWIIPGSISDAYVSNPTVNPDSSGWYYVQVFGTNGCPSDLDSVYVTVYPLPIADAGPDLSFCDEAPGIFLQGSVGNPFGGYSVKWMPSTGLHCDTCLVTYAQPTQTTIYTLVITNLETGCASDSTTLNTQSSALITVKDLPVVDAGRDTIICLADSAMLLGTVTGSGPLYTWDWSPSLELNDRTLQTPNASPFSTTIFFVVATSNGCESHADSMELQVIPYPVVAAGQQKNICSGDSVQLAGQVQQGTAQYFEWTPATGLADSSSLTTMASPATTTTYTLTAYNQGCPSLPASMLLIVNPTPIAEAGLDTVICADGDSMMLYGSYTNGYFPFRYKWTPMIGLERDDIFSPMAKPSQTQFYYFTVSSGTIPNLCETTDSVLITVVPSVNLNLSVDTTIICPGEFVQFTSTAGIGNATFQWSPTTGISNPNSQNVNAYPQVPTRYFLTASEGGCSQTDSFDIFVHPNPQAEFVTSQVSGCAPVEVRVQNLSQNALSYQWRVPTTGFVSNEKEPVFNFAQPGNYAVQLVVRGVGGCQDTTEYPIPVEVKPNAGIVFLTDPPFPVEIKAPTHDIRFEDNTPGAISWLWDFGDGNYSELQKANHNYKIPGNYTVTLRVKTAEGCEGTASAGLISVKEAVLAIPNVFTPNGDGINDFFSSGYDGDELFMMQIFDRWGTKYFETRNRNQFWDGKDFNGQEAEAGVYFYVIEAGESNYSGSVSLVK